MEKLNNKNNQNSTSSINYSQIKSKAFFKYSSVLSPGFVRLKHNTDLNLPPPNWLSSEAESYGVGYMSGRSQGFSSFQMANMFPEYIGKVDIVSDAENIKNLSKIPYDKKSVSMMVHKIDKTLLLDEFDVEKHIMEQPNNEWLKKFFYNNIVGSFDNKEKCVHNKLTHKVNTFKMVQKRTLLSKFLHHSITIDPQNDIKNNMFHNEPSPLATLPQSRPEEVFPDNPKMHKLFNHNVLWNFENLQMLIGTNLPIFRGGKYSSLSSRLRDKSKSLSMLTGIDYWLDNLMCGIPEIELCYHLNGIIQNYELVKTEDLPYLNESTFSPNDISDIMQNIFSFIKSNANSVGHTYWLFKGKNDNVVKLYDLTILCSESIIDSPNQLINPVTMFLYNVACQLKHNPEDEKPYNPITIILLLNNCLKLLDKTKYPRIVTSVNYMLSDLYISVYNNNPSSTIIEDLTVLSEHSTTCHVDTTIAPTQLDNGTYLVNIENICVPHKKENIISLIPENSTSKHLIKTIEACCYKALYHIGGSLRCLQYFKNDKTIIMVKPKPASSSKNRSREIIGKNKNKNKDIKKKNSKQNNRNKVVKNVVDIELNSDFLFYNIIAKFMPSWHNPPNAKDGNWWKNPLGLKLYEKASDIYLKLGKKYFESKNYGLVLKYFRQSLECKLCVTNTDVNNLSVFILQNCGNCFLQIFYCWDKIEQYKSELESDEIYDFELREILLNISKDCTNKDLNLIPRTLNNSIESILNGAEHCCSRALALQTNIQEKKTLNGLLGSVYNVYSTIDLEEITTAVETKNPLSPMKFKWLTKKSKNYFTLARDIFKKNDDKFNFIMTSLNKAQFYRSIAQYSSIFQTTVPIGEFKNEENLLFKAVNIYMECFSLLEDRSSNPFSRLWDTVNYELSSTLYCLALKKKSALCRNKSKNYKECIDLFMKALKYCDLKNDTTYRFVYEYRTAIIHFNLAVLSSNRLEKSISMKSSEVNSVFLQIKSDYNISFEIYFKIDCPLESLEVLIKMIALDMRFIDDKISMMNVKYVKSIIETLGKCNTVFQIILKNKTAVKHSHSTDQIETCGCEDMKSFKVKKEELLLTLKENLLILLKCMIQFAITKTSKWLVDKEDELKTMYDILLINKRDAKNDLQIMKAVRQLSRFSDNSYFNE